MNFKNYFKELKRRNVFKAALAYLVVAWVIVQVASIVFPAFKASPQILRGIIIILIIGFPVWLVFAWLYEMTPEGLKKTESVENHESITHKTSSKLNKLILGALAIAIVLLGANLYSNYTFDSKVNKNKTTSTEAKNLILNNTVKNQEKSVAVLAFENMSSDKDQEFFSDGISEEIINQLSKSPELTVISRTSSFFFKNKEATIKEIGKKLDVNYLVEGSVRKAGNTIRITAQLIYVPNSTNLWSETYDRKIDNVFKIQDEIANTVSSKLKVSLRGNNVTKEINPDAYTAYLKAKDLFFQANLNAYNKALELCNKALELQPNYAPALVLKGRIYISKTMNFGEIDMATAKGLITEVAEKAISVQPDYASAYSLIASLEYYNFNFKKSKRYIEKALKLEPENTHILLISNSCSFQPINHKVQNLEKILRLDPLSSYIKGNLGGLQYLAGNNEKALNELNMYTEIRPDAAIQHYLKALVLLEQKKMDKALTEAKKERDVFSRSYILIKIWYHNNQKEKAFKELREFIKKYPTEYTNIADIYAKLEKPEKAFEYLFKAVKEKDYTLVEGVYYPSFKKLHNDPRWQQLLTEMGVPKDNGIPGYKGTYYE